MNLTITFNIVVSLNAILAVLQFDWPSRCTISAHSTCHALNVAWDPGTQYKNNLGP